MRSRLLSILVSCVGAGCAAPATKDAPSQAAPTPTAADPTAGEVSLGSRGGFDATLAYHGAVGVWTVECLPVLGQYGCPQIVALDDAGRCIVLNSYSGKWTPNVAVQDGQWLGGVAFADVDPRREGRELYIGGQRGNLYQVWPHPQGGFDANVIAYIPGHEIHTLVAGELDDARAGVELFAFTHPGGMYALQPGSEPGTRFDCRLVQKLTGRVRDAAVVTDSRTGRPAVVTVSRAGEVALLTMVDGAPEWRTIFSTAMGLGRLAVRPGRAGDPLVLYITCDDGRIVRLAEQRPGEYHAETIYAGPQGPRGVGAGRFHEDATVEAIAVFGYSRRVELLTRSQRGWLAETIFEDADKGHWLATGELDGRNTTDEIVLSGYSGRVVLLARPPGYGRPPRSIPARAE